jgi:hypothetical protein
MLERERAVNVFLPASFGPNSVTATRLTWCAPARIGPGSANPAARKSSPLKRPNPVLFFVFSEISISRYTI